MKTLYLHIGTPKTGTTAIQNFCNENAAILEQKGYCYPLFPFKYDRVAQVRNGHFLVCVEKNKDGSRCEEREREMFEQGMKIVNECFQSYDHVILSDESIWRSMDLYRENFWENLKKVSDKNGFQIRIIVYLRRQDKFLCSLWNQHIKSNTGRLSEATFENYISTINKSVRFNYYAKVERIAAAIGKENVIVKRFEKERFYEGNIYADFLWAVGLPMTEEYTISKGVRNQGLYGNTHEIKRILNENPKLKEIEIQNFMLEMLREHSEVSAKQYKCEMFSKKEAEEFLGKYEEGNRRIAAEYLHEPDGELFDNTIEDVPKWEKNNPYMQDDLIRFIGTTSVYLFEENQKLKQELREFEYKVRHPFKTLLKRVCRKFKPEQIEG